jgi:hypothetical protein
LCALQASSGDNTNGAPGSVFDGFAQAARADT